MAEPRKKSELGKLRAFCDTMDYDLDRMLDEFSDIILVKQGDKFNNIVSELKTKLVDEVKVALSVELVGKMTEAVNGVQEKLATEVRTEIETAFRKITESMPQVVQAEFARNKDTIIGSVNQLLAGKGGAGVAEAGTAVALTGNTRMDLLTTFMPLITKYMENQGGLGNIGKLVTQLAEAKKVLDPVVTILYPNQSLSIEAEARVAEAAMKRGMEIGLKMQGTGATKKSSSPSDGQSTSPTKALSNSTGKPSAKLSGKPGVKPRAGKMTDLF